MPTELTYEAALQVARLMNRENPNTKRKAVVMPHPTQTSKYQVIWK